jgi:exonuclease III
MIIISLNAFESPLSRTNKARLKKLTKELLRLKPDIICLQEIIKAKTAKRLAKTFTQFGYQVFCQPKKIFNHGGLWCAVKLPVLDFIFIPFKKQGSRLSLQLAERIIKKGFQRLALKTKDDNVLILFNTHLASIFKQQSKKQLKTRLGHVQQLINIISSDKNLTILSGDCNFTPHDPEHHLMEKSTGLVDPMEIVYYPTVSPQNTNRKKSLIWPKYSLRHDYTWISKGLSSYLHQQKIIFDQPYPIKKKLIHLSDHYGIWTELRM